MDKYIGFDIDSKKAVIMPISLFRQIEQLMGRVSRTHRGAFLP